jgi:hypothetical protein
MFWKKDLLLLPGFETQFLDSDTILIQTFQLPNVHKLKLKLNNILKFKIQTYLLGITVSKFMQVHSVALELHNNVRTDYNRHFNRHSAGMRNFIKIKV